MLLDKGKLVRNNAPYESSGIAMHELKITFDRYDGQTVAAVICPEALSYKEDDAWIVCRLGEDDEFEVHFKAENGTVSISALEAAKELMRVINAIDNEVQKACAAECKRTGLHPRNFENMLAYVKVYTDHATLRYFGTGVNTEWDEHVSFDGANWKYLGASNPNGLSSR